MTNALLTAENALPWGQLQTFADEEARHWQLGDLILAIQRHGNSWLIGKRHGGEPLPAMSNSFAKDMASRSYDLEYQYLYHEQKNPSIRISPIWPDRAIVLHTKLPFFLSPDSVARLMLSIPLWCRIETSHDVVLIDNLPTVLLSETWLGENTMQGKFCYAYRPKLLLNGEVPASHEASCPLIVKNNTQNVLRVDRIEWLAPYIGVYAYENHLTSLELSITYEDNNEMNIQFGKSEKDAIQLTPPRIPHKGQLLASFIHSLTKGDA